MTEGMVAEWHINDREQVKTGQLLYALETEKVTMEIDAEANGIVRHLVAPGISCEPGQVIGYIYGQDEQMPDVLPIPGDQEEAGKVRVEAVGSDTDTETMTTGTPTPVEDLPKQGKPVLASPIAKKLARESGLQLADITGTGPRGRIVEADVKAAIAAMQAGAVAGTGTKSSSAEPPSSPSARRLARELDVDLGQVKATGARGRTSKADVIGAREEALQPSPVPGQAIPLTGMRKTIAGRMHESLRETAQLTMDMVVLMDEAINMREQLIQEWQSLNVRPTVTDLVARAVIKALQQHPIMNSQMTETEIVLHGEINLGIAVALDEGLMVPVIRNAQALDLLNLSQESSRLASAAKNGSLGLDEMKGGTFTVSAMGMFGVDSFTPILNMPEVGILGINRLYDGVGWENGLPVRQKMMKLSLTWDHRVLDGAPAANFLKTVCELLESPYRLIV
jgi:pyruvate dehydrogenase E2 component (dihydrolipoamide acetyltransferase)